MDRPVSDETAWIRALDALDASVGAVRRADWRGGGPALALGAGLVLLVMLGGLAGRDMAQHQARAQLVEAATEDARQNLRILTLEVERLRAALPLLADESARIVRRHATTDVPDKIATLRLPLDLRETRERLQVVAGRLARRARQDAIPEDAARALGKELAATRSYLMNACGEVISLNIEAENEDFIGKSFYRRSYFQELSDQQEATFYGVGLATGVPGIFLSRRIDVAGPKAKCVGGEALPFGAAVFKLEFAELRSLWGAPAEETAKTEPAPPTQAFVTSNDGVIRIATTQGWECGLADVDRLAPETKCVEEYRGWPRGDDCPADRDLNPQPNAEKVCFTRQFVEVEPPMPAKAAIGQAQSRLVRPIGRDAQFLEVALPIRGEFAYLEDWGFAHMRVLAPIDRIGQARAIGFWTGASTTLVGALLLATALIWSASQRRRALLAQKAIVEEANRKLSRANRIAAMSQTAAEVAHEIAQPASVIQLRADLALAAVREARDGAQGQDAVGPALERATAALERILSMSARIEAILQGWRERRSISDRAVTAISLAEAIAGSISLAELRVARPDVAIVCHPIPPVRVQADPVGLDQIIVNLLTNAIEALRDTPNPQVEIAAVEHDDSVEVVVSDNGPGVPADQREAVFEWWTTTKEFGSGIGLAIARDIALGFGGGLSVDQAAQGGAQFRVLLPKAAS